MTHMRQALLAQTLKPRWSHFRNLHDVRQEIDARGPYAVKPAAKTLLRCARYLASFAGKWALPVALPRRRLPYSQVGNEKPVAVKIRDRVRTRV